MPRRPTITIPYPERAPGGYWKLWSLTDFRGGLNVRGADADRRDNEAADLWNVLVTDGGRAQKRSGYSYVNTSSLPSSPRSLCWWRPVASKSLLYAVCTSGGVGVLIQIDTGDGSQTQVVSGLASSGQASMVTYGGKLIIADGSGRPWFYDYVNSKSGRLGIDAPTTALTAAEGASGNLNGSYQWCVTFRRYDGSESNASSLSSTLSLTNKQANLTSVPTSADALVTARCIYRTGGTLSNWYKVGTINDNTTTTFTDNVADSTAVGNSMLSTSNGVPPSGLKYLVVFGDRIYGTGSSRVYWSELSQPNAWGTGTADPDSGTNYVDIDPDYGGSITGMAVVGRRIVIAKPAGVWYFHGSPPSSYTVGQVMVGAGTPYGYSMVSTEQGAIYLGSQDVWITDGLRGQILPDDQDEARRGKARGLIAGIDTSAVIAAAYFNRYYLCALKTQGPSDSSSIRQVLVYDFRTGAWTRFDWQVNCWAEDDLGNLYAGLSAVNYVAKCFAGTSDAGSDIRFYWKSRDSELRLPLWQKRIGASWVEMDQTSAMPSVTIDTDEGTYTQTVTASGLLYRVDWPADVRGRHFRVSVDETSAHPLTLSGVTSRWLPVRML